MSKSISSGSSGPCGACKFLRRKCATDCIFAPYFDSEQGATHFAAVHKVFGASNVSKLLQRIPPHKRLDAVVTICYEAQARLRDPVYGCVSHIFALQQQVVNLQAELAYVQTHLSRLELPPQPRYLTTFPGPPSVDPTSDNSVIFNPQQPQQSSEMLNGQDSLDLHSGNVEFQALAQEVLSIYFPGVVNLQAELAYVQTHLSRLELPPQPRYLTTFPGPPSVDPTSDNSVIFNPQQPQQSSEMLNGQDSLDLHSGNVEFQALAQEVLSIYFPGVRFPPSKSC